MRKLTYSLTLLLLIIIQCDTKILAKEREMSLVQKVAGRYEPQCLGKGRIIYHRSKADVWFYTALNLRGKANEVELIDLVKKLVADTQTNGRHDRRLGKIVLKLAPGINNPRNSEGSFATLKNGNILFVYTKYIGKRSGDHDPAILASRISRNGGKTWSTNDKVVVDKEGKMNVMSVSLLRLKNGDLALFYLRKNSEEDCVPLMRTSKNDGKNWSEAIPCITDKKGYFVLNNDRVIQLSNGRLLMAVALHKIPREKKWNEKAKLFSYYSDDNGKTWLSGQEVSTPKNIITQEPGLVELKSGDVMMFIRASGGVQYLSYSKDKGAIWSLATASNIKSPLSPASVKRIPRTEDLIMIWNNNDGSNASIIGKRTPLTIAISKDEGKTWLHVKDIETDPDGWYCYIATHFYKDSVLLGYCAGSQSADTHLSVTDIRSLSLKSLYK